jgi:hypothetical protein
MAWYSWNIAESGIKHQKSINQASKTNMTIISCELWKCNLFSSWHIQSIDIPVSIRHPRFYAIYSI